MRAPTPTPKSAKTEVVKDGYQLCARCGKVMVNGETAIVVPRRPLGPIYTHPEGPECPPKAVKGWKAVLRVEGIRESENAIIPRPAEPVQVNSRLRECVCILDDKHLEAELKAVELCLSNEAPLGAADVRRFRGVK